MSTNEVTRTTHLDAAPDDVRRALHDDELLGEWLGAWRSEGDDRATVTTDDGVVRSVRRLPPGDDGAVRWTWWPGDDDAAASTVEIRVVPDGTGTRLTVTETRCGPTASVALDGLGWAVATLALEVALLLRSAVRV